MASRKDLFQDNDSDLGSGATTTEPNEPLKKILPDYYKGNTEECVRTILPMKRDRIKTLRNPDWSNVFMKSSEVVVHDKPWDCWVSMLGIVKDLTPLVQQLTGSECIKPILRFAGKDISCWFNKNGELRTFIHPVSGVRVPFTPYGAIPHVTAYNFPHADWEPLQDIPWWEDESFNIARLTSNSRPIRIMNVSTRTEILMHVCEEETFNQIQKRYKKYNSNAESYTWKYQGVNVNMNKTLTENNILDLRTNYEIVGLPVDTYIPCITLYYNDDFKTYLPG